MPSPRRSERKPTARSGTRSSESFPQRWRRRALTFTAYALAWPLLRVLLPIVLTLAGVVDGATDRRFPRSRALLFVWVYLACECAGLAASLVLWVGSIAVSAERARAWHYALQGAWASALLCAAARLFSFELRVAGDEHVRPDAERHARGLAQEHAHVLVRRH